MAKSPIELSEDIKKDIKKTTPEDERLMVEGQKDWKSLVDTLIKDEHEAIDEYDGAIEFINSQEDMPEDVKNHYLEVIREIKADEEDHVKKLEGIKGEEKDGE